MLEYESGRAISQVLLSMQLLSVHIYAALSNHSTPAGEHSMVMLNYLKEEEQGAKNNTAASLTTKAESRLIRTHDRSLFPYIHPSLKYLLYMQVSRKKREWGAGHGKSLIL